MEQHPIPQQISSYEFKLVGEMTLRQFIRAAAGIIIALLINSTKLIFIVKWPLIILFGGGGLMLAFVPLQDRPLETWIMAFLKSVYSPTIYLYKKRASSNWLNINPNTVVEEEKEETEDVNIKIKDKVKVKEFIQSLPSVKRETEEEKATETVITKPPVQPSVIDEKKVMAEKVVPTPSGPGDNWKDQVVDLNLKKEKLEATGKAVFGAIPMPDIPDVANIVVGMATDIGGKIMDGVIIEIQDEHGNPSRVLKTNSLGQFRTSTPLATGKYLIIAEKDGFTFDRVNIEANGQIIKPIRLIAGN